MPNANLDAPWAAGPLDTNRLRTTARWIVKLRWVAVLGQVGTVLVVVLLGVTLPTAPLLGLVGLTLVSNVLLDGWARRAVARPAVWHGVLGGLMLADLGVLTAMLALTGGPTNPCAVFYFVNLALASVVLPGRWAWSLCAAAVTAFASITVWHLGIETLRDPRRLQPLIAADSSPLVAWGAVCAFSVSAVVIVGFATRLTRELHRSQDARRKAERLRAKSEKLEALGTLAAGAAHELASPLSTIAVVARELELELEGHGASQEARHDIRLIRDELTRCRAILDRMSSGAGKPTGEAPTRASVSALCRAVLEELPGAPVAAVLAERSRERELMIPVVAVAQALRALVRNGLDASRGEPVELRTSVEGEGVRISILDRGTGFDPEVLRRVGEPFFTTKEPGKGMGLGVFLARNVVERLGGEIRFLNAPAGGAEVQVWLPAAPEVPAAAGRPLPSTR